MRVLVVSLTCMMLVACAAPAARNSTSTAQTSVPAQSAAPAQTTQVSETEMLRPGPNYVANFPLAEREAACTRLNYRAGTEAYDRCLEGFFPENPGFRQG